LYKIVVLGDGGVGKTAIAIQFSSRHFVTSYDPTIEDSYRRSVVLDGEQCVVEILDTAGQEEYTALRDQWIRDGEAFVLVYNIWSRSSFTRITRFHNQIQRIKEGASRQPSYPGSPILPARTPRKIPTMLVGHDYQDEEVPTREREVREAEGRYLAMELGCEYLEASAERCINIDKIFFDLVRILRDQRAAIKTSMVLN
ncbi:small GTPase superfamily, partial [Halenospora varia]